MANPYGRPRTRVIITKVRLPEDLMAELMLYRPELFRSDMPGVFAHGALSGYVVRLITADLRDEIS